jgi:glycosyltransferase involved in cell wall biosynthesis
MQNPEPVEERRIACVGTYPPRQCGIATFTQDICNAIETESDVGHHCHIIAINDLADGYSYPASVRFEVRQQQPADYRLAADFVNIRNCEVMLVQHEYGIFGGDCGEQLLGLLRNVRMPVVTTMHTVLSEPSPQMRKVTAAIIEKSDRIVVMSNRAVEILCDVYDLAEDKVRMIPHGIPDLSFVDTSFYKDHFGVEGRTVLLTFGLLSPGKGIEYMIRALPELVEKNPELVYVVLGATHPHVLRDRGEEYRHQLQHLAEDLGVLDHVMFINRYVELDELCKFLMASDIYVTPSLGEQQIASGTLAYALGAGKPVVATPYVYAKELLSEGRGRLVPFRDSDAIAREVGWLLDNEQEQQAIRKRAYLYSRKAIWSEVARSYLNLFDEVTHEPSIATRRQPAYHDGPISPLHAVPEVNFAALRAMTDNVGILQHAQFTTPDRNHGYCTDDNSRALVVALQSYELTQDHTMLQLAQTYLSFLLHAFNPSAGRFRNFMGYDRHWQEEIGSEDSHARALWGLGCAVALARNDGMRALALDLFDRALHSTDKFTSPRAWAFALVGVHAYLSRYRGDSESRRIGEDLANRLYEQFVANEKEDWPWPEDTLTYSCGKLPHAMLLAGQWMQHEGMIDIGLRSLDWLLKIQTGVDGHLSLIGNRGWLTRGGTKAPFDQQPVEAHAMLEACLEAHSVTKDHRWFTEARRCFDWYLGRNELGRSIYNYETGGCRDGLHEEGVNENEGAESTLAWLLSLRAIRAATLIERADRVEPVKECVTTDG